MIYFLSNNHIMVYKNLFIIDLRYMQSIKQLRDSLLSVCGLYGMCLYLYDRFEKLRDELPRRHKLLI